MLLTFFAADTMWPYLLTLSISSLSLYTSSTESASPQGLNESTRLDSTPVKLNWTYIFILFPPRNGVIFQSEKQLSILVSKTVKSLLLSFFNNIL
jgi:hypothetical protein